MIICSLILSTPAYGMIYRWIDSARVAHYTNKVYEIPERYRSRAKALFPESSDTAESQLKLSVVQAVTEKPHAAEVTPHTAMSEDKMLAAARLRREKYIDSLITSRGKHRKNTDAETSDVKPDHPRRKGPRNW